MPWAHGQDSEVPRSTPPKDGEASVANVDTAIEVADGEGLRHPMTVALPADDEDGVFSVIGYAFDAPSDERTVHVDRYGGEVVSTYGFDDYPLLAKVVSQGIGLHEGRSLGLWSFWGSALMCLRVIFMCVTGPLMWWRRRPRGGAGWAPRAAGCRSAATPAAGRRAGRARRVPAAVRRLAAGRAAARPARAAPGPGPRQVVQRSVAGPREAVPAMRRAASAGCGSGTVTVTLRPLVRRRRRAGPVRTVQTVRPGVHQKL